MSHSSTQKMDHLHISSDESEAALPDVARSSTQDDASTSLSYLCLNTHDRNNPRFPPQGVEGSYGPSSAPSDTGSVASTDTLSAHHQEAPRFYTAYGPAGQVVQQRAPSVVTPSDTASVVTASTAAAAAAAVPVTRSGWAKIPSRKMNLETSDTTIRGAKDDDNEPKRFDYYSDGSEDEC